MLDAVKKSLPLVIVLKRQRCCADKITVQDAKQTSHEIWDKEAGMNVLSPCFWTLLIRMKLLWWFISFTS